MVQRFVIQPTYIAPPITIRDVWETTFSVGGQRSWAPEWTEWVLPWTLVKDKPGVLTVAIDVGSFYGTHQVLAYLKRAPNKAGALWRGMMATYLAVALKLGVSPAWIAALVGAVDIVRHNEWLSKIKAFVDSSTGGVVMKLEQMWLADP